MPSRVGKEAYVSGSGGGDTMTEESEGVGEYWDQQADDNVLWHISHSKNTSELESSGRVTYEKFLIPYINRLPNDARVLEIGCGIGRIMKPLAINHPDFLVFGVDVSKRMVQQGFERLHDLNNVVLLQNNGLDLSLFPDGFFDFVYSYIVFQHMPRRIADNYAAEVRRITRSGGYFLYQFQTRLDRSNIPERPDTDFRTIRMRTPKEAREFSGDGFVVVDSTEDKDVHDFVVFANRL